MKHSFDWRGVCPNCHAPEYQVNDRVISRMCSVKLYVFFAGPQFFKSYYCFTDAAGNSVAAPYAKYDPALDYPDEELQVQLNPYTAPEPAETRPGLCAEEIDKAAYDAFMRDLSS